MNSQEVLPFFCKLLSPASDHLLCCYLWATALTVHSIPAAFKFNKFWLCYYITFYNITFILLLIGASVLIDVSYQFQWV